MSTSCTTTIANEILTSGSELFAAHNVWDFEDYLLGLFFTYAYLSSYGDRSQMVKLSGVDGDGDFEHEWRKIRRLIENSDSHHLERIFAYLDEKKLGNVETDLALAELWKSIDARLSLLVDLKALQGELFQSLRQVFMRKYDVAASETYTSPIVCQLLSRMIKVRTDEVVGDIASKSGGLLLESVRDLGPTQAKIEGIEKNLRNSCLARMSFVLSGWAGSEITVGDYLTEVAVKENYYDVVLANPPFSMKFDHRLVDSRPLLWGTPPYAYADYAFLSYIVFSLKENGRAAVVVPPGVLSRAGKERNIRASMTAAGFIQAVISLPGNTLTNTRIPVAVLKIEKTKKSREILFVDAESRSAAKGSEFDEDDIAWILDQLGNKLDGQLSRYVGYEEVAENNFDWSPRRYVRTCKEAEVDLNTLEVEIQKLEADLATVQGNLSRIMGKGI